MAELLPLGPGAWLFVAVYLSSFPIIGVLARRARTENSLKDFYLGGSNLGVFVLFLTLFATQYSGNTFFGFTGATYRMGYAWVMCLHFMTAVIVCYLLIAPKLYRLARIRGYLTPADYIQDRYGDRRLTVTIAVVMLIAMGNFLLAQLMAMGRAVQGLALVDPSQAYIGGVIVLSLIISVYGALGGLRAVAWTDVIQGIVLGVGFCALSYLLFQRYGALEDATRLIQTRDLVNGSRKALVPEIGKAREWLSYVLTVGFAASLYPMALQRIFAARTALALRRSLAIMAFMPLLTMVVAVIAGIFALAYIPGLSGANADQAFGRVLRDVQQFSTFGYALVVLLLVAVVSAMMSTADSALLSISSMITKDVYQPMLRHERSEQLLTRFGKLTSWILIAVVVALAIALKDHASLVQLLDRKLDILLQLVPAFVIGLHWRRLDSKPVFYGLLVGLALALGLAFGDFDFVERGKVAGFHAGLVALVPNSLIACGGSMLTKRSR